MSGECDKCGDHCLDCKCSKYRYWEDDGLQIRSCVECNFSEFKSPEDDQWILYCTQERANWYFDQLQKNNFAAPHCKTCTGLNEAPKYQVPLCNWCNKSDIVRECGPNYICYDCEMQEREAGRPLVFTSPVRNAYFLIEETK